MEAGAVSTATNSYGLSVNAQTGASNNYAAQLMGGNVGIGTSAPSTQLHTTGGVRFQTLTGTGIRFVVTDANGNLAAGSDTTSGIVSGSGTLNYVPKWTPDGATLGNSQIFDNGTNVGIGTAIPGYKLTISNAVAGETRTLMQLIGTFTGRNPRLNITSNNTQTGTKYIQVLTDADDGVFPYLVFNPTGGNVGIGTVTPSAKLHVNGSVFVGNNDGTAPFRVSLGGSLSDYGSVAYGVTYSNVANSYTYAVSDYASMIRFDHGGFKFKTAPSGISGNAISFTDAMTIDSTAKVGIGTTTPAYKLTVNSQGNTGTAAQALHGQYFGSFIGSEQTSSSYYALNVASGATANTPGSGTSRLYVRTDGNVGIGTTNPIGKLEVSFADATTSHNAVALPLQISNTSNTAGAFTGINFRGVTNTGTAYAAGSLTYDYTPGAGLLNSNFHLRVVNAGNYSEALTVLNSGNVGIGTGSPSVPLEVNGAAKATSFISNSQTISSPVVGTWYNTNINITSDSPSMYMVWGTQPTGVSWAYYHFATENGNGNPITLQNTPSSNIEFQFSGNTLQVRSTLHTHNISLIWHKVK